MATQEVVPNWEAYFKNEHKSSNITEEEKLRLLNTSHMRVDGKHIYKWSDGIFDVQTFLSVLFKLLTKMKMEKPGTEKQYEKLLTKMKKENEKKMTEFEMHTEKAGVHGVPVEKSQQMPKSKSKNSKNPFPHVNIILKT